MSSSPPKPFRIGGPNTILPPSIESLLSWSLCLSCLSVSCYHYIKTNFLLPYYKTWKFHVVQTLLQGGETKEEEEEEEKKEFVYIPLTTHSKNEINRFNCEERLEQLLVVMHHYLKTDNKILQQQQQQLPSSPLPPPPQQKEEEEGEELKKKKKQTKIEKALKTIEFTTNETLIHLLRTNDKCRRLTSLALRPSSSTTSFAVPSIQKVKQRLQMIYPKLLPLPFPQSSFHSDKMKKENGLLCTISLIVPLYRESPKDVLNSLQHAHQHCTYPERVEVVLVDANHTPLSNATTTTTTTNNNDENNYDESKSAYAKTLLPVFSSKWKDFKVCIYTKGGGRGCSLNYGAAQSCQTSDIYTFCHSDTLLPLSWDVEIQNALLSKKKLNDDDDDKNRSVVNNACAFGFGISRSNPTTTTTTTTDITASPPPEAKLPPGLSAVETTANLRTKLFTLPYGDQTLSLTSQTFIFLGGFPDQCLMEDYELVSLLRQRASFFSSSSSSSTSNTTKEQLYIIQNKKALCSPRRWYKFGVLYVTYMNSKFVNLYAGGMSPDDLYCLYYGCKERVYREDERSPWEVDMDLILAKEEEVEED